MVNFSDWLENQLKLMNMTPAELARASGKAPAVISRVLNGDRKPEPDTLIAIARALNLPPETVFRAAGLLPPVSPDTEYAEQILHLLRQLSPQEQEEILELLRFKAERQKTARKTKSREKPPAQAVLKGE
jgi:transcriptional regulator with XRE-family HTH domain